MKKFITLIIFAVWANMVLAQKVGVAQATGTADEGVRATITDAIGAAIRNSGYDVVERSQYDRILEEQELQASDFNDDDSRIEFGALLGAQYLCVSSVNKIAQNYFITYRLIDVKSGVVLLNDKKTATETNIGEVILALYEEKLFTLKDNSTTVIACGLEIQKNDLKGSENCSSCGAGWRLPSIRELQCMYENRKEIGNFLYGEYLSRDKRDGFPQGIRFNSGSQTNVVSKASIRCVKDL